MSDDDLLRGYLPAGPPPDLRWRVLRASGGVRLQADQEETQVSLRDWLPAVAAAALIILLQVLAAGMRDRAYDQFAGPSAAPGIEVPLQ